MKSRVEFFAAVIFIIVSIVSNGARQEEKLDQKTRRKIETQLTVLNEEDLSFQPYRSSIDILNTHITLNSREIDRMLRRTGDVSGNFSYNHLAVGIYTMSAQAVSGLQNIVNSFLVGYQPFEVENFMMPLYILSQRKSYVLDEVQYPGRDEVWQTSKQGFYYPRGDCEDHALALADWLIEMGEDARVVLGHWKNEGHAWVVLFKDGKEYLLESTQKSGLSRSKPYPVASLYRDYYPEYMFNRHYFWENTGSKFTSNYSSEKWKKKSRYNQT
jgi:hypothetical protein